MTGAGDRIKRLREKEGLTQLQLAEKLNMNNSVLSRIEAGKRPIEDTELRMFADYFKIKADYLLGRTDDPNPINETSTAASSSGNRPYMAYFGGPPEELDEEEAAHLEQELEMFRAFREKRLRDKGQQKDK